MKIPQYRLGCAKAGGRVLGAHVYLGQGARFEFRNFVSCEELLCSTAAADLKSISHATRTSNASASRAGKSSCWGLMQMVPRHSGSATGTWRIRRLAAAADAQRQVDPQAKHRVAVVLRLAPPLAGFALDTRRLMHDDDRRLDLVTVLAAGSAAARAANVAGFQQLVGFNAAG